MDFFWFILGVNVGWVIWRSYYLGKLDSMVCPFCESAEVTPTKN